VAAASRVPTIKGTSYFQLPWDTQGDSVAVGPEGVPWFGTTTLGSLTLASAPGRTLQIDELDPNRDLVAGEEAGTEPVGSLAIGPEGNVWFARGSQIIEMTPTGGMTRFPLGAASHPGSIVAGPDGNLWFSENGRRGRHKRSFDRIGRITVGGKVTQFPIGFGAGTEDLAADPHGPIWFTTQKNEIASISTAGRVGARGCLGKCSPTFNYVAVGPDRTIGFALAKEYTHCLGCGGGTALILQHEGAVVGEIPAGALRPAS
jgi:hypothetical protein